MSIGIFAVGDRVRLRTETADDWIDPKLQRAAKNGRPGTVTGVLAVDAKGSAKLYAVNFDDAPRTKALRVTLHVKNLEALP